jgi:hypothetical protein
MIKAINKKIKMKKRENTFPSFYKALGNDKKRPAFNYAIVENGKIVIPHRHYMICSDFGIFVEKSSVCRKESI